MMEDLIFWLTDQNLVRLALGLLFFVFFTLMYLQITSRSGIILLVGLIIGLSIIFVYSVTFQIVSWVILIPMLLFTNRTKENNAYKSARAAFEVNDICGGLTEGEVSILLGEPVEDVITVILLALINKEILEWDKRNPVKITLDNKIKELEISKTSIQASLLEHGIIVGKFEEPIIEELLDYSKREVSAIYLGVLIRLIQLSVMRKIQPFDLIATRKYYEQRISRSESHLQGLDVEQKVRSNNLGGNKAVWLAIGENKDLEAVEAGVDILIDAIRLNIVNNQYLVKDSGGKLVRISDGQPIPIG